MYFVNTRGANNMIKLIAFDLDGTLTQHKTKISDENRAVLDALSKKYRLVMVGAGKCQRIFTQLGEYPIDIIGNYGLTVSEYDKAQNTLKILKSQKFDCDRASVIERAARLRERFGFTEYRGDSIEFHDSGCVTFALLGTKALQEEKLAFDPDRTKRRKIYKEVCDTFPEYSVFVGGSSSFDMAPRPYDKRYALELYCKEKGFSHDEVIFVGDDYGEGGNDESVYKSDFGFIKINDYRLLREAIRELL